MKLNGVVHGGETVFGGIVSTKWRVMPAAGLLDQIEQLPSGSKIGIEAVKEAQEGSDLGGVSYDDDDLAFWEDIIYAARARNHTVEYLDSLSLHVKSAKKQRAAQITRRILLGLTDQEIISGKERDVTELGFALEAVSQYIFQVEREDQIFSRLQSSKPNLSIIGIAHSDQLMQSPKLVSTLGVDSYSRWVVDGSAMSHSLLDERRLAWQERGPSEPDKSVITEREVITRQYNAALFGRVTMRNADWIGSWDKCRPAGLFEIHIDKQERGVSTGTVEDCIGTAPFTGQLSDDTVRLVKEYDPRRVITDNYLPGKIVHEASLGADGLYSGRWYSEERPDMTGPLLMKPGNVLYTSPDLEYLLT